MKTLRHGDWTIIPVEKIEGIKVTSKKTFTFGEGEATNHFHTITVPKITDMNWYKCADGSWVLELKEEGIAKHPEHSMKTNLRIPPGLYKIYQRREKDWFSLVTRKVID